ncbi:Inner membrane protein YjgN [Caballeronia novacaledonica]|uniref:Inner membrane protein YjgN n=1 Tax=Caballeronia novacaledonica TaxID=1544861 RepID=A0A2U3HZ65_9BURK|nr:YjgN family protein [Caballeronia novacaledonica]SPB13101.1 Inner membrane protein YjgN [Caballeronia novacaledonica]
MNNTQDQTRRLLDYDGETGELFAIFFKNLLLTLLTFGIYRFWGTSNLRRYVWSHMRFQGERFTYTGTGGELFKGFVIALAAVIGAIGGAVVVGVVLQAATGSKLLGALPTIAVSCLLAIWAAGAFYSAERYRLSRTSWRGIHGGMTGSAFSYGVKVLLYSVLCVFSLYQLIPWMSMRLAERRINSASFGDRSFHFEGKASKIYGSFLLSLVGSVVLMIALYFLMLKPTFDQIQELSAQAVPLRESGLTPSFVLHLCAAYIVYLLGAWLIACHYLATVTRHVVNNTSFGGLLQFGSRVTTASLMKLILGNLLLIICTLGFGFPLALQRSLRFTADNLVVTGKIDLDSLHQSTLPKPETGEGMLSVLEPGGMI